MKTFILLAALVGIFFTASAQTNKNAASLLPPKGSAIKASNGPTDIIDGTFKSKSGVTIKWAVSYNAKEKKVCFLSFEQSGELSPEAFNKEIQALSTSKFWEKLHKSLPASTSKFMNQTLQDCKGNRNGWKP